MEQDVELQHPIENCQLSAVKKVVTLLNLFKQFGAVWLKPAPWSVHGNEQVQQQVIECQ